ncbi:unnamed protein product [Penicillium salamii]|uniref:Uncharacterized protein n=1 Tax=Penicillium salamii TaxID=1612424 RepID=A0A9W4NCM5_9EURO|nr:unnamed protein product [Penicillium salamii]CAG8366129.1 unnamed protein product [Penicillium salamii]CAG8386814.1 unnamed protein product [Penicillium salamii]CAG8388962.1 unnamed protein product [Penicillium salamii]
MTSNPYFNTVTSKSSFRTRFLAENRKLFSQLRDVGASDWGRDHLFACRVIRRHAQHSVLPTLSPHHLPSDLNSSPEIVKFLNGPDIVHMALSEHRLVRDPTCGVSLGQIWGAMAMFKGSEKRRGRDASRVIPGESDGEAEPPPKRPRLRTERIAPICYVDSGEMKVGSSSPEADSSESQGTSSVEFIDAESHKLLASPEDETLRLISCVIRHILYFASPQDSADLPVVVEFRDAKTRLSARTPNLKRKIIAIDDGGLCLRQESNGTFQVSNSRVAVLEAKRQFQCLENGQPIISDDCFAQMTCEALVAKLAGMSERSKSNRVLVIHATQHYICFLDFEISDEYVQDFESHAPSSFLYVDSTPWFDLSSRSGREQVVKNLCGIMRRAVD